MQHAESIDLIRLRSFLTFPVFSLSTPQLQSADSFCSQGIRRTTLKITKDRHTRRAAKDEAGVACLVVLKQEEGGFLYLKHV